MNWHEVFEMGITEFFNIVSYSRDKNAYERQQLEKWKKKH